MKSKHNERIVEALVGIMSFILGIVLNIWARNWAGYIMSSMLFFLSGMILSDFLPEDK